MKNKPGIGAPVTKVEEIAVCMDVDVKAAFRKIRSLATKITGGEILVKLREALIDIGLEGKS